jgi:hypothetical protein
MLKQVLTILLIIHSLAFLSCNKYKPFIGHYNFRSENGQPDYSDLNYWAAHPDKHDPSDSIPQPLQQESGSYDRLNSPVDVFFLHPTTYTHRRKKVPSKLNAAIDDKYINAKTDYSTILYQASVFNGQSRIFAPRYRQAHISLFFTKDKRKADAAFDIAYNDLKTAFEYYLQHWNNGRPIILASHSQGSKLGERLLKEFFENKPLQKKLVVAYLAGWPVPKEYFSSLPICKDSLQTGCICSWRTFRKGYTPYFLKNENGNSLVTNPLTWSTDEQYAPRKLNKGSVLKNFNKIFKSTTDAQIHNGLLWVKKPKFPWSFLYFRRNYHIGDINLFYVNIRENVRQRISAFLKN